MSRNVALFRKAVCSRKKDGYTDLSIVFCCVASGSVLLNCHVHSILELCQVQSVHREKSGSSGNDAFEIESLGNTRDVSKT